MTKRAIQFECKLVYLMIDDNGLFLGTALNQDIVVPEAEFSKTFAEVADSILNPPPPPSPPVVPTP